MSNEPDALVPVEKDDSYLEFMWRVKKEQIEHLKQVHKNMQQCTRNYDRINRNVLEVMKKMSAGYVQAIDSAKNIAEEMVNAFLGDSDAVVQLINIKGKDEGIYHHSINVSVLSLMLGKKVNLTLCEMNNLGIAALFHDIGKSRIDLKILRKKGAPSKYELSILHQHPQYGTEILTKCGIRDADVLRAVKEHHELFNGTGYPLGLKGQKISKLARIIAIVDIYDNLCNNEDNEKRTTPYEALSHMYTKRQEQIDVDLFSTFVRCLGIYPPGTVVQLSNGETGIVVATNPVNALKPSLLLYDSSIPREEALICEMEDNDEIAIEKSIRIDKLPESVQRYLSATPHITYFMEKAAGDDK